MKPKRTRLFNKAWKLCSEYIRRRDKGICFTCGNKKPWKMQQAGHFIHGKTTPIYFNEYNISSQCVRCNKWLHGNLGIYGVKLIKKYGQKKVDELMAKKDTLHYYTIKELKEIIDKYEKLLSITKPKR